MKSGERLGPVGWLRFHRYVWWSRLIHHFNYHRMPLSYPDGDVLAWCQWCGLRAVVRTARAEPDPDRDYERRRDQEAEDAGRSVTEREGK